MECTQRLESESTPCQRICLEQIGFLGILGTKYPVVRGPNKVGRDPQTCSIVLNLNSISRQHAVVNVLSGSEYMLMDLDSANKTKLNNKVLPAYIPAPLSNGDMVQFGEVFGVFRLLEEDTDLPATQAVDIPDTPVISRMGKLRHATIPESPEISDRDDSFVAPSQPISHSRFKSPRENLTKHSRTLSNKINNDSWDSCKKSSSFNLDVSGASHNEQSVNGDIHEAETQPPNINESTDSIYTAATQIPDLSPSIHSLQTQLPENLPAICKISDQHEMEVDLFAAKEGKHASIYTAETQLQSIEDRKANNVESDNIFNAATQFPGPSNADNIFTADTELPDEKDVVGAGKSDNNIFNANTQMPDKDVENNNVFSANTQLPKDSGSEAKSVQDKTTANESNEIILFDDLGTQDFMDEFQSQPLISPEINKDMEEDIPLSQPDTIVDEEEEKEAESNQSSESDIIRPVRRSIRIKSDSSTDCEDIQMLQTQKIPPKSKEDDLTDCEEDLFEADDKKKDNAKTKTVDFEDLATQVIAEDSVESRPGSARVIQKESTFEEMATQIIPEDNCDKEIHFEDLPTQVLEEDFTNNITNKTMPKTKIETVDHPFKIPLQSSVKIKRKDTWKTSEKDILPKTVEDDDKYYAATQEIFDDLCSQRETSPEIVKSVAIEGNVMKRTSTEQSDEKIILNVKQLENELSPQKKKYVLDTSSESTDGEERVKESVKSLSNKEISDVIGVDIANPKKVPSDGSDEWTPKKRLFDINVADLPNSQEIRTTKCSSTPRTDASDFFLCSEPETQNDSQENTPIVFHKKKRITKEVKKDLTVKFDMSAAAVPSKIMTRIRKPTAKAQESDYKNILKPKFCPSLDDAVDLEIITENLTRLRNKGNKDSKDAAVIEIKKEKNDSNEKKIVTRRNNDRAKKTDTIVDLTKLEEVKTEKSTRKSAEKNPVLGIPLRPRGRRQNDKVEVSEVNEHKKIDKEVKIEEKAERPKSRGPRNTDRLKKKDTQEKITNYTVTKRNDIHTVDESMNSTKGTTRISTRSKDKETDSQCSEPQIVSSEKTKRKRGRPRKNEINRTIETEKQQNKSAEVKEEDFKKRQNDDSQPEEQVRRSRRQRLVKETNSQNQTSHEQSTVYNLSSESTADSPKGIKRSATGDTTGPSKRTRAMISSACSEVASISANSASVSNSVSFSRRSTPSRGVRPYHVLFTAIPHEDIKGKLENLGAVIVGEPSQCSVAVTMQLRRTVKLLCCVGLGRPVVGPAWVQACVDNQALVDPWQYLLKDVANEQRFSFDLEQTLLGPRNYLKGYNVSATPNVLPSAPEMKQIVECSGGSWKASGPRWVVVSCKADSSLWPQLKGRGATAVVSSEFILTGVLRQQLNIEATTLF